MNKERIMELKAIIACRQSDGYLVAWAKKELEALEVSTDQLTYETPTELTGQNKLNTSR